MRRLSPKALVIVAAVLTALLLAYVFAGGSARTERPPSDRLSDRQAGVAPTRQAAQQADPWATLPGSGETAPPPLPSPAPALEPDIEPGVGAQPAPVVRPAPPAQPRAREQAAARELAKARETAKAREQAKARAQVALQAKRKQDALAAAAVRGRQAAAARRTAQAAAPAPVARASPSFNCRYARTGSEIAVCSDAGLASLDRQMAAQFSNAVRQGTPAQRAVLERSRMRFLNRRERCRTQACIAEAYRGRMSEINDIAARNWRAP